MASPTHNLYVKQKGGKHGRKVGVGWINDRGWISIKLDPCTCLTDRDDVYISLYPRTKRETTSGGVDDPEPDIGEPPDYLDEGPPPEEDNHV